MKKVLKWFFILLGGLLLILIILGVVVNESKPTAAPSSEADALATKMMEAVNKAAWDTTHIISWDFPRGHHYLWDKQRHFVKVNWSENEVLLHTKTVTGKAFQNGQEVVGEVADHLVYDAWGLFCNDSWWLNAAVKAHDEGTKRSIVTLDDGRKGLMVHYESGGTTPGDSYVWILDAFGLPKSYKMWVSIIPIGGLEFTWEDWIILDTGAKIATMHRNKLIDLPITNVKGAVNLGAYGLDRDPFEALVNGD